MALIVGGTTVTGTQTLDATKLTGNLPALSGASLTALSAANITASGTLPVLNGSNLTSLPSASTIPVVAVNTVGSFGFLGCGPYNSSQGNAYNSSNYGETSPRVRFSNIDGPVSNTSGSGTWRMHGLGNTTATNEGTTPRATVWQRIS
tara:strand:- start:910 stop:1353 length:444 start_codon:yes stop_codon:yes gene_type:complete